ncbi:tRNA pseudouridine synthase 1 [Chytridiales sp. JEL 0842]|nr:tRNA pseudouridine synthase 1 [Chytridiales sp. JEL 0842]
MVGLAILMVRWQAPPSLIKLMYNSTKVVTPKAPALGLLLRYPVFGHYNRKWSSEGERPAINFEQHKEIIDPFVEEWIYTKMIEEENREHVFFNWTMTLEKRRHVYAWCINSEGVLKPEERIDRHGGDKGEKEDEEEGAEGAQGGDDE